MLLLSLEFELKMGAELVTIDKTLLKKEKPSFALEAEFTANHQINLVLEDWQ